MTYIHTYIHALRHPQPHSYAQLAITAALLACIQVSIVLRLATTLRRQSSMHGVFTDNEVFECGWVYSDIHAWCCLAAST